MPDEALLNVPVKVIGELVQVVLLPEIFAFGGNGQEQFTVKLNAVETQLVPATLAYTVCEPFATDGNELLDDQVPVVESNWNSIEATGLTAAFTVIGAAKPTQAPCVIPLIEGTPDTLTTFVIIEEHCVRLLVTCT